jgi:hypothetical protein
MNPFWSSLVQSHANVPLLVWMDDNLSKLQMISFEFLDELKNKNINQTSLVSQAMQSY